jgi:hypothetical protein
VKFCTAIVLFSSVAFAASPIGVITAGGSFRLEGASVWGNSTLFDGARIETTDASSELALAGGVKVQLAAGSSARVWKGHLNLERGTGLVTASSEFQVTAAGVTVEGARYRVDLRPQARLEVAAFTGNARVLGARGSLLAAVPAGSNMSFAMQQTVTRSGCLVYKGNGFILQVDDSPDVLQLEGGPLAENVGNHVMVTGSLGLNAPTITPATLILNVVALLPRTTGGCLTVAAALNAQTSVPPPTSSAPSAGTVKPGTPNASPTPTLARSGMSTGAKVAIVGAIAGGGAGAALALGGKKSSTSP